ncbi:MAG: hypothetical protein OXH47_04625, partial [Paracoccaceae bacterium]|nr:hypothetical protein [Paracoccaceae bacterium]
GKYPERILKNGQLPYKKMDKGVFIEFCLLNGFIDGFSCWMEDPGNCQINGRFSNGAYIIYIRT